jgi:hypothetical protein
MKTTFIAIMLFLHSAINPGKDPAVPVKSGKPVAEATDGFTLARSDENIRILYRWVITDAPHAVRQLKAEFIADCPANRILEVIHDDNHFQEWMSSTKTYYRTWVEYFVLSNQVSDIPKTLTDPIIQKNLLRTMNAFRETVRERSTL